MAVIIWSSAPVTQAHAWQYTTQPGDSLYMMGKRFGVPWEQIQAVNTLSASNVPTGKAVNIPDVFTYTVRQGDSLFALATRFGTAEWAIKQLNGLSTDTIFPGQTLQIPNGIPRHPQSNARSADVDLLARLIEAEASGEPYIGKVAVGAVVLNRVKSDLFPNSLSDVVYEKWQFEPVQNGRINLPAGAESQRAAREALNGSDPTKGALFFFNPDKTSDGWMRQRTIITRIGGHLFAR